MAGGNESPPHQLGDLGERCKLPQRGPGRCPGKFGFWSILGPQKSRQNGQLAFESEWGGGQQVNLGGSAPVPQRRSAPDNALPFLFYCQRRCVFFIMMIAQVSAHEVITCQTAPFIIDQSMSVSSDPQPVCNKNNRLKPGSQSQPRLLPLFVQF